MLVIKTIEISYSMNRFQKQCCCLLFSLVGTLLLSCLVTTVAAYLLIRSLALSFSHVKRGWIGGGEVISSLESFELILD